MNFCKPQGYILTIDKNFLNKTEGAAVQKLILKNIYNLYQIQSRN